MEMIKWRQMTLLAAAILLGTSAGLTPAYAEDTAVTDAVQALTDAVTSTTSGTTDTVTDAAAETAADEAAGLPKFNSRQERHEYLKKLQAENPDKFKEVMKKRHENWAKNHPNAAQRMKDGKPFKDDKGQWSGRDFKENRWDRREDVRDRKEDVRDRREDIADRREDRWDAKHDGGKWDKMEDRADRREDVRDRREDVRDRAENRMDRRENRWDANHGPDQGRPGPGMGPRPHGYQHPGQGAGRPVARRAAKARANQ